METRKVDIVVIGAGIAGLSFARTIKQQGREVLILERSRTVGGRCATWRHVDMAMDYGVPFLHARSPLFWHTVDQLLGAEVLSGWPQRVQGNGLTCQPRALDSGVRHAALRGGLNTLAKKLAEDIEILRESEVTSIKTIQGSGQLSGANFSLSTQTLIIFVVFSIIGMLVRMSVVKALRNGLMIAAGFQGVYIIVDFFLAKVAPAALALAERFGGVFTYTDVDGPLTRLFRSARRSPISSLPSVSASTC